MKKASSLMRSVFAVHVYQKDWPISDLEALPGRRGEVWKNADGYPSIRQTLPEPIRDKVRIMHLTL